MLDYGEVVTQIHQQSIPVFFPLDDVQLLLVHDSYTLYLEHRIFGLIQTILLRLYTGVVNFLLKLQYNLLFSLQSEMLCLFDIP
jgi:hypothetical protein